VYWYGPCHTTHTSNQCHQTGCLTFLSSTTLPLKTQPQSLERAELEANKQRLILENSENERRLSEVEDGILRILDEAQNILEDETAIEVRGSPYVCYING